MVKKKTKKSIFSKVFNLSVYEQGSFGTGLGMFLRLYNGLYVTHGLAEKIAKNTSENGFFGSIHSNKNFIPALPTYF